MTDIRVRSALIRVRWNDMPVRLADSSVDFSASFIATSSAVWITADWNAPDAECEPEFPNIHYTIGRAPRSWP
jgi:hypothetical protein